MKRKMQILLVFVLLISLVTPAFATGEKPFSQPKEDPSYIYIGELDGDVQKINTSDQTREWTTNIGRLVYDIAVPDKGNLIYVGKSDSDGADDLWVLYKNNGTVKESKQFVGDSFSDLVVTEKWLFAATRSGRIHRINRDTLVSNETRDIGPNAVTHISITKSFMYIGTDLYVYKYNRSNIWAGNSSVWTKNLGNGVKDIGINETGVWASVASDGLYALNKSNGDILDSITGFSTTYEKESLAVGNESVFWFYDKNWDRRKGFDLSNIINGDSYSAYIMSIETNNKTVYVGLRNGELHTYDHNGFKKYSITDFGSRVTAIGLPVNAGLQETGDKGTPSSVTENRSLELNVPELIKPNQSATYTVTYVNNSTVTNVTASATVVSNNTSVITVNQTTRTLHANASVNTSVNITANYTTSDGFTLNDTKKVVVAELTVENLPILPPNWRPSAALSNSAIFFILLVVMVGVLASMFVGPTGAIGAMQLAMVIGWYGGYVGIGITMVSLFVGLFIGLNTALNVDYAVG